VSNAVLRGTNVRELFAAGVLPISPAEVEAREVDVLEAKELTTLDEDDLLTGAVGSGAGFGDPLRRDPELVARDVLHRLVSAEAAHSVYGVVIRAGALDSGATALARDAVRARRLAEGRPCGGVSSAGRLEGGEVLHAVADTVEAVRVEGQSWLRCSVCHERLGDYGADYKRGALVRELPLTAASPMNARCDAELFVLREFCCPGCGTALAQNVQPRSEPIREEGHLLAG
jgi:N-methylhydantoinase B